MRPWPLLLLAFLPVAAAGPLVGLEPAGPAATTLYLADVQFANARLDLWEPQAAIQPIHGAATLGCTDLPGLGVEETGFHTWYAVPFPGAAHDNRSAQGAVHDAPGLWADLLLQPGAPATLHWYLESEVPVPQVSVRAVVRAGDAVSVGNEAYNTGDVVAQGQTAKADLSPLLAGHPHVEHESVDGRHVYHFAIPLAVQAVQVPAQSGFNLRVDAFVENPLCPDPRWPEDRMFAPGALELHGSPGHQPRLEWTVAQPLTPLFLQPQKAGDVWVLHAAVESPWGPHDLDVRLLVDGPGGRWETVPGAMTAYKGHGRIDGPAYLFAFDARAMAPGLYAATLVATNAQGTANATAHAAFHTDGRVWIANATGLQEVKTEPARAVPGPGAAPALLAVGAGLVAASAAGRFGRRR